jgi:hypothetical protein
VYCSFGVLFSKIDVSRSMMSRVAAGSADRAWLEASNARRQIPGSRRISREV